MFPNWEPGLAADMREETLSFFEENVWKQHRPLSELLNAQVTFALAEIHRIAQEGGGTYFSLLTAIVASDLVMMTHKETKP